MNNYMKILRLEKAYNRESIFFEVEKCIMVYVIIYLNNTTLLLLYCNIRLYHHSLRTSLKISLAFSVKEHKQKYMMVNLKAHFLYCFSVIRKFILFNQVSTPLPQFFSNLKIQKFFEILFFIFLLNDLNRFSDKIFQ